MSGGECPFIEECVHQQREKDRITALIAGLQLPKLPPVHPNGLPLLLLLLLLLLPLLPPPAPKVRLSSRQRRSPLLRGLSNGTMWSQRPPGSSRPTSRRPFDPRWSPPIRTSPASAPARARKYTRCSARWLGMGCWAAVAHRSLRSWRGDRRTCYRRRPQAGQRLAKAGGRWPWSAGKTGGGSWPPTSARGSPCDAEDTNRTQTGLYIARTVGRNSMTLRRVVFRTRVIYREKKRNWEIEKLKN